MSQLPSDNLPAGNDLERVVAVRAALIGKPELCAPEMKRPVIDGTVVIGMTPVEAQMAGGAFAFAVQADKRIWPPGSSPYDVMERQATEPDKSRITLTFANGRQYRTPSSITFKVEFRKGRVSKIARLS